LEKNVIKISETLFEDKNLEIKENVDCRKYLKEKMITKLMRKTFRKGIKFGNIFLEEKL
jgi:hypothetical protein